MENADISLKFHTSMEMQIFHSKFHIVVGNADISLQIHTSREMQIFHSNIHGQCVAAECK